MKEIIKKWLDQYFGTEEAILLTLILVLSLIVIVTLGSVLAPVLAALIFAFLLQGVINSLERRGVPRVLALGGVYLLFIFVFVSVIVGLVPIIGRQTSLMIAELPSMIGALRDVLSDLPEQYSEYISPEQFQLIWNRVNEEVGRLAEQVLSFCFCRAIIGRI